MKYNNVIDNICYIYFNIPDHSILSRRQNTLLKQLFAIPRIIGQKILLRVINGGKVFLENDNQVSSNDKKSIWLVVNSVNTANSLDFLSQHFSSSIRVGTSSRAEHLNYPHDAKISFHKGLLATFRLIPLFVFFYKKYGYKKLRQNLDVVVESVFAWESSKYLMGKFKPGTLIFSNDHLFKIRALLLAAKSDNIPTCYIQHASVSEYFPPLEFDLSLLEGQDTLDKYKAGNKILKGKVELVGMPKLDAYVMHKKTESQNRIVGICGNLLDSLTEIQQLIQHLREHHHDLKIWYRPHPRDKRQLQLTDAVSRSDATKENIFRFLQKVDFLIASNTSTHLEAALLNVPSAYFEFGKVPESDYYGYVAHGLVPHLRNKGELSEWIAGLPEYTIPSEAIKYFNAAMESDWEGNSEQRAIRLIEAMLKQAQESSVYKA